jgi:hypothetical protein
MADREMYLSLLRWREFSISSGSDSGGVWGGNIPVLLSGYLFASFESETTLRRPSDPA